MERPAPALIQIAYNNLFHSPLTISKLKDAAIHGHLRDATIGKQEQHYHDDNGLDVPGRSVAWKVFLIPQAPLTSELSASPASPLSVLKEARSRYVELLQDRLRAPDGSYEEGLSFPGQEEASVHIRQKPGNWEQNNPLSLDEKNPWQEWFTAMDLRRTIAQDVERTFPDLLYFRQPHVQNALTTILFLHCSENPQIGYRQGMHELLAPIFYIVDYDSLLSSDSASSSSAEAREFCDRTWVNADSWCLFEFVMRSAGEWYEWQEPSIGGGAVASGPMHTEQYVPPIVRICNSIQVDYLRPVDPALWARLQEVGIEPQIYGMYGSASVNRERKKHEFGMMDCLPLWDGIFAADPTLDIAKWVCVAMLALFIRSAPTPTSGVTIVMENRDTLGITFEAPEPPPLPTRRQNRGPPGAATRMQVGRQAGGSLDVRYTGGAAGGGGGVLQDMIASRFNDVNSAVFSTVSEFRRNLPELSLPELPSALLQRPATTTPELSSYPFSMSPGSNHRKISGTDSSTRFELEKEIAAMRNVQMKLGHAVDWSLDVLQRPRLDGQEDEERIRAVECMAYVRDVLMSGELGGVDERRLARWEPPRPPPVSDDPVPSPEESAINLNSNKPPAISLAPRAIGGAATIAGRPSNHLRPGISINPSNMSTTPPRTSPFSRYEAPSPGSNTAVNASQYPKAQASSSLFARTAPSTVQGALHHSRSPSQPLPQKQAKKSPAAPSDPLGVL
ncbi:hypothetical protein FRB98_001907 [Tulasnella sp. 332]|nr:hypothetical protein FRB98_001907 [Tulasnella sp. 332]